MKKFPSPASKRGERSDDVERMNNELFGGNLVITEKSFNTYLDKSNKEICD